MIVSPPLRRLVFRRRLFSLLDFRIPIYLYEIIGAHTDSEVDLQVPD